MKIRNLTKQQKEALFEERPELYKIRNDSKNTIKAQERYNYFYLPDDCKKGIHHPIQADDESGDYFTPSVPIDRYFCLHCRQKCEEKTMIADNAYVLGRVSNLALFEIHPDWMQKADSFDSGHDTLESARERAKHFI